MTEIFIECEYTLLRERASNEASCNFTFKKTYDDIEVEISVSYLSGNVTARVFGASIDRQYIEELLSLGYFDGDKLSAECRGTITGYFSKTTEFTKEVLSLIKYHLSHDDLKESLFSVKSQKWGLSADDMCDLPTSIGIVVSGGNTCPLRESSFIAINESINAGVKPLLAMRHLHRAKHEYSAHHMWIDATIAAELAIKEVLCRAKPELKALLLDMPSPPISKLYGSILENYLGKKSPYRSKLIKGQEVRNKLIHRHDAPSVEGQLAVDYVADVERAIFHLLTLLYPTDSLISQTYRRKTL